ncbi:Golgi apparatus membrane protein tvp38 [Choanephora cucurbitarum]|uniref:Golgi apparatus membrane protein TVP38 n=1 Tax=Choanephora cucurbitarum TaxID=101091 RepID=A0A1C7MZS2_9FUNG|nr:Golgi apparatus membrane protein tvp38 [Choanephora cucurbitarum]
MKLPSKKVRFILYFVAFTGLTTYLFVKHREALLQSAQHAALRIKSMRYGIVLMGILPAITSIPPIFGFTLSVTLNGFIYGFPLGCIPATIGSFVGSVLTLILVRQSRLLSWLKLSESRQEKFEAIEAAIGQAGFKMLLLVRICPIPWQLSNLFLSLCQDTVSWQQYTLAAFIASFKYNWEVWVGSQLADLSNPDLPPTTHRITLITMAIGLAVLAGVFFWLYRATMQKLNEHRRVSSVNKYQAIV